MNARPARILVVEDELQIRRFVRQVLERAGYRVAEAATRDDGLAQAAQVPDLLLLDLGLPDGDGVAFVRALRDWTRLPVLSARTGEQDKIGALDAGADDYLTKPFSVGELLARVRALLRRAEGGRGREAAQLRFGEVEVDLARRTVTRAGQPVHLTAIEYRLLATLLANAGKVMTHRQLLHEVWGPGYAEATHYLRVYVGHLRQKLEADPLRQAHFRTEIGVGYRFQE